MRLIDIDSANWLICWLSTWNFKFRICLLISSWTEAVSNGIYQVIFWSGFSSRWKDILYFGYVLDLANWSIHWLSIQKFTFCKSVAWFCLGLTQFVMELIYLKQGLLVDGRIFLFFNNELDTMLTSMTWLIPCLSI